MTRLTLGSIFISPPVLRYKGPQAQLVHRIVADESSDCVAGLVALNRATHEVRVQTNKPPKDRQFFSQRKSPTVSFNQPTTPSTPQRSVPRLPARPLASPR